MTVSLDFLQMRYLHLYAFPWLHLTNRLIEKFCGGISKKKRFLGRRLKVEDVPSRRWLATAFQYDMASVQVRSTFFAIICAILI
jgi:hypothetical protein